MKRNSIFLVLAYFLVLPVYGMVVEDRIEGVERGGPGDETLVKLKQGRVLWLDGNQKAMTSDLEELNSLGMAVRFEVDEMTNSIQSISSPQEGDKSSEEGPGDDEGSESLIADYTPTNLPDMPTGMAYFTTMDKRTKSSSQCYNRAHGWSYDLWRTRGLNSMKLFLFFTSKYIRSYRYHWWFHVTPMSYIAGVEHTFDRSFTTMPLQVKTWTDIFMYNNATCRSVSHYSHYRRNQNAEWCYLIRASQYYRTPSDLELYERNGRTETAWVRSEIRQARRQAFIYWRNYDP